MQFGWILGSLERPVGRPLRGFLRGNFESKKYEKQRVRAVPSAGDADPGQGGFLVVRQGKAGKVQHALAPPKGGRADCLRFASPAEATWGLGGLEAGR